VSAGDFNQFIKSLDDALKCLYKSKAELLICGDIRTHCLIESTWEKKEGASLLTLYNLLHTVYFATRIQTNSLLLLPLVIYLWITVD
jgi:hypothetical protein